jgi:hypothetical protein
MGGVGDVICGCDWSGSALELKGGRSIGPVLGVFGAAPRVLSGRDKAHAKSVCVSVWVCVFFLTDADSIVCVEGSCYCLIFKILLLSRLSYE